MPKIGAKIGSKIANHAASIATSKAQTRPLVSYYSDWAQRDPANAPKYRAISGTGSVEEITARALAALAG